MTAPEKCHVTRWRSSLTAIISWTNVKQTEASGIEEVQRCRTWGNGHCCWKKERKENNGTAASLKTDIKQMKAVISFRTSSTLQIAPNHSSFTSLEERSVLLWVNMSWRLSNYPKEGKTIHLDTVVFFSWDVQIVGTTHKMDIFLPDVPSGHYWAKFVSSDSVLFTLQLEGSWPVLVPLYSLHGLKH